MRGHHGQFATRASLPPQRASSGSRASSSAAASGSGGGGRASAPAPAFALTDEQKIEIREAFDLFDTDGSGADACPRRSRGGGRLQCSGAATA
jgi:hypothetical protein